MQVTATVLRETRWYAIRHGTCWSPCRQQHKTREGTAVARRYGERFYYPPNEEQRKSVTKTLRPRCGQ